MGRKVLVMKVGGGYLRAVVNPSRTLETSVMDGPAVTAKSRSKGGKLRRVKFGSVTVMVRTPTEAEVQRNVDRSTQALARGLKRLLRPGVRLYPKRGVPLFYVDEDHPGKYVRLLDGKRDLGVLEDGDFKVTG